MGLQLCWNHLLVMLFGKMIFLRFKSVCKVYFMTKLCNHYPTLTLVGCVWKIAKVWLPRVGSYSAGNEPRYRYLVAGYDWIFLAEDYHPFQIFVPTKSNLSSANEDFRSANTMCSVTCSRGKFKFGAAVSAVLRIALGNENFHWHLSLK